MHHNWKICYSFKKKDGSLLEEDHPFREANIEANTAEEAIASLKNEFPMYIVDVHGAPCYSEVSDEEFNRVDK